jgi:hypothetical protein
MYISQYDSTKQYPVGALVIIDSDIYIINESERPTLITNGVDTTIKDGLRPNLVIWDDVEFSDSQQLKEKLKKSNSVEFDEDLL